MKRSIVACSVLLPSLIFAFSLEEAVQKSMEINPQVLEQKEMLNAQIAVKEQVTSGYLPSLDVAFTGGPEVVDSPNTRAQESAGIDEDATTKSRTSSDTTVSLTQNVFNGLETYYGSKEEGARVEASKYALLDKSTSIGLQVTEAYLNVLNTKERMEIADKTVKMHERIIELIRKKVEAGVQRESDYQQTLSRLELARNNFIVAKRNYFNSIKSFQRILPVETDADTFMKPEIGALPAETADGLLEMALNDYPMIKQYMADISASQAAHSRAASGYYPSVDLELKKNWSYNKHAIEAHDDAYSGMVLVNYNLYNGGADSASRSIKMAQLMQSTHRLADAKNFVSSEVAVAYSDYMLTSEQLEHLAKHVKSSEETVSDYNKEFDLGRRSLVDLLNIEQEYNAALLAEATTSYEHLNAYFKVLAYSGTLLNYFNAKP